MSAGLSIVVPAYNEAHSLATALKAMAAGVVTVGVPFEIMVVNDGSTDETGQIADALAEALPSTRVVHHGANQGFGGAVRTGIRNATYDLVLVSPVDSPPTGPEVQRFLTAAAHADIVIGYRETRPGYNAWMRVGSKWFHRLVCWLFDLPFRDVNWIHLYRRAVVESLSLRQSGIVFLTEVLAKARRKGYLIAEIPSEMRPRRAGRATVSRPSVVLRSLVALLRLRRELRRPEWRRGVWGADDPGVRPVA